MHSLVIEMQIGDKHNARLYFRNTNAHKMFYAQLALYPLDKPAAAVATLTNKQT